MSVATPYQFIKRGNLFIVPVGPSLDEVPYQAQSLTKPPDYSLWVNGKIQEPALHLDSPRMPPSMYQEVRDDLVRYSPVEVTRSAFRRSQHAYVGVIDSKGTPYYFALDSRGISVRELDPNDTRVWKTFDHLADEEHRAALRKRRSVADTEMLQVDRELSEPSLVVTKGLRYGRRADWKYQAPGSSWWRTRGGAEKQPKKTSEQRDQEHLERYEARLRGKHAIREKLRAERAQGKRAKPMKPRADDTHLNAWRQKYPSGNVEAVQAHPFAKTDAPLVVSEGSARAARLYVSEYRRVGAELAEQCGEEDLDPPREDDVDKALPRGGNKEAKTKKVATSKASKKQTGAGGKTRYTYPQEKKGGAKKTSTSQVPLIVQHDDTKHADPAELANQLGVSVRTLHHTARRLGRDGFEKFMRSHLKRFAAKHRLDPDYWGTLYERLQQQPDPNAEET